jgi:hypothetical protein
VGTGGIAPQLFTTALYGGEWSVSSPVALSMRREAPTGINYDWVAPKAGMDGVEYKKKIILDRNRTPVI